MNSSRLRARLAQVRRVGDGGEREKMVGGEKSLNREVGKRFSRTPRDGVPFERGFLLWGMFRRFSNCIDRLRFEGLCVVLSVIFRDMLLFV